MSKPEPRVSETERRLFLDMMSHVPVGEAATAALFARMVDVSRHYHGVCHLTTLWRRHLTFGSAMDWISPSTTTLIACAIAYHDCVHDPRRDDNETKSADLWMDVSAAGPLDGTERDWVAATIRATAHHAPDGVEVQGWLAPARVWVLDLDLTPLGESPETFDANTALLRREVPHLTEEEWDVRRLGFLRRYRDAPRLYRSPVLAGRFEQVARRNIARQLG